MPHASALGAWLWAESFWLPPGHNWSYALAAGKDPQHYPAFNDIYRPIKYALVMLAFRVVFEWTLARPFGRWLGIADCDSSVWRLCKQVASAATAERPAAAVGPPPRRVLYQSTLDKFAESSWRFLFYVSIFFYGLWALWDKPWLNDVTECWRGYILEHTLAPEIWLYYMLEASFYWSLMFSSVIDARRKDFTMHIVHHGATLALMCASWASNFVRVGSLVLLLHDAADMFVEVGKMANYSGHPKVCNGIFAVFVVVWFVTRCGIFPATIIYSCLVTAPQMITFFNAYYAFAALLCTLQLLHFAWSYMILKILIRAFQSGQSDDIRSDEEPEEDESTTKQKLR